MRGIRLRWLVIASILLSLAGFIFLRGPIPDIKVKSETLFSVDLGPLPVNFTNTMITSWIVVALMVVLVILATRRWELVPRGVQNLVEAVLEWFYNLVVSVAGEKNGRRFFPVVATFFFFILFANWFSLLPIFNAIGLAEEKVPAPEQSVAGEVQGEEEEARGKFFVLEKVDIGPIPVTYVNFSSPGSLKGKSIDEDAPDVVQRIEEQREKGKFVGEIKPFLRGVNTDLNTPIALAIVSAFFVESWGISSLGLRRYGRKFFNLGRLFRGVVRFKPSEVFQGAIDAFVGILELISETVRLISFSFRLFGNMFAGEVVILVFVFLTPLMLALGAYFLEVFVGIIQAFIFAMLTLVFGVMAVSHGPEGGAAPQDERQSAES